MGCGPSKENIESEILILRLMRTQIQEERNQILKELERITGTKIIRARIPDYLVHTADNNVPPDIEERKEEHKPNKVKKKKKSKKKIKKKQSTKADEEESESIEEEEKQDKVDENDEEEMEDDEEDKK